MPEADRFEAPQGGTFHGNLLEAVTEAFAGNGILDEGEGEVTPDGSTLMGIDVAAAPTGIRYAGNTYNPSSASFTLSDGPTTTTNSQDDRRVDIVYLNAGTGSYAVTEGTADPNPVPPTTPSNALLLAVVLVPHGATDLSADNILNWRAIPSAATPQPSGTTGFEDGVGIGKNGGNITETSSPTGFTFTAGNRHDVWNEGDVTLSNSSGASATEDVTLTLYDGTDSNGTQLGTDTQSVSLSNGNSTTITLLTSNFELDGGDYFVEVTTSGSDLAVDETVAKVPGLVWDLSETNSGYFQITNSFTGTAVFEFEPLSDELNLLNAAIDTAELADDAVTQAKVANDAVGSPEIIDGSVDTAELAATAVTQAKIASGAVGSNEIADGSVTSTDISDGTIQDADISSSTTINRGKLDDELIVTGPVTTNTTTSGEEVVLVDPSGTGSLTITLASSDVSQGNVVQIIDVGGAAQGDNIIVDTEGTETIDGDSTKNIDSNYGSLSVISDGTNWNTKHKVVKTIDPRYIFEGTETGAVANGDQGVLTIDNIENGETVEIYKSALTLADATAAPTSLDLKLVVFDNAGSYTEQLTLITGDGSTVYDSQTGNPLGSYTNSSGSPETIGVFVDNQTGASQNVIARVEGITNK